MTRLAPLLSSVRHDWRTPSLMLDLVRTLRPIGLDPATSPDNPTRAARYYTPALDGLAQPWRCAQDALIYVNPPYGRSIGKWVAKAVAEAWSPSRPHILMLLPARPDASWWQDYVGGWTRVLFWRGRLRFEGAAHASPFPSAIWWQGQGAAVDFDRILGPYGWTVRP